MIRDRILRARKKLVSKLPVTGELLRGSLLDRTVRHTKAARNARAVKAIRAAARPVIIEASGGITLRNVAAFARAGVDWISVGQLTHSAPGLDISLEIER